VGAVGKAAEHVGGFGEVCGFAEDLVGYSIVEGYGGVGAEDIGSGVEGGDGLGLFEGEALDSWGRSDSSMSAGTTSKERPAWVRRARRRGEAEARMRRAGVMGRSCWFSVVRW
jgi:hypothetical protein